MVLNGVQNSCGNSNSAKCSTCNLNFFCSKSPYCKITHIEDNFDAISRFMSGFYNQYQNDITAEKEVFSQIQQTTNVQDIKISEIKDDYNNKYIELNNKLDQLISFFNNKSTTENTTISSENEEAEIISDSAIALYDGSKKYIEKKNLFGKTKWVEDK